MNNQKLPAILGWLGVGLITCNSIPAILAALKTGHTAPLSSLLMMVAGLSCCLYQSLKTGNTLYCVANGLGVIFNLTLVIAVLFN